MSDERLVAAWLRWNAKPADEFNAQLCEAECQRTAEELGITSTEFRSALATLARAGIPARSAIRRIRGWAET